MSKTLMQTLNLPDLMLNDFSIPFFLFQQFYFIYMQKNREISMLLVNLQFLCTGQFQNRPWPPGQTPGHLTFLKNFGQIPRYVASLDGQMPHPLELQRGSNPPLSRHVKQTVETSSAKFSTTTNFLFSLSSLHTLNKGIFHDRTI